MECTGTFFARNAAQAMMFEHEFKGQISDGMWENTKPYNHYEFWCGLDMQIAPSTPRVERSHRPGTPWPRKNNYALNSWNLLEYVGRRTYSIALVAKFVNELGLNLSDFNSRAYECLEEAIYQTPGKRSFYISFVDVEKTIKKEIEKCQQYAKESTGWGMKYYTESAGQMFALLEMIEKYYSKFYSTLATYSWPVCMKDIKDLRSTMKTARI